MQCHSYCVFFFNKSSVLFCVYIYLFHLIKVSNFPAQYQQHKIIFLNTVSHKQAENLYIVSYQNSLYISEAKLTYLYLRH